MRYARGRQKYTPGTMNKTEQAYSDYLLLLKRQGLIEDYWFEGLKLKLANNTFYTPDFFVLSADLTLECHEVKGFWEDDARVKIKVAAERFYFIKFIAMKPRPKKEGGGWAKEEF